VGDIESLNHKFYGGVIRMAKEVVGKIKLQLPAGKANPAPPVEPAPEQPVKPETPAEQPATEPVVSDNNGVKTGDSYHMVWYIAAMTLTAGIACVELKRKKTFDK
jgi:hypothetical protein